MNRPTSVPEGKATGWTSYRFNYGSAGSLEVFGVYSWISEVYYSPFEAKEERAKAYGRADARMTYTAGSGKWVVSGYVNNIFDKVGNLQILREGEDEFYRHSSGTTLPRMYGVEFSYMMGNY